MTRLDKITAATRGKHDPSPRGIPGACSGEAPALINEASARNDGWGNQPICKACNRGARYSCTCDPFYAEDGEPDCEAEKRVRESLERINWLAVGLNKPEGFERVEA